MTPEQVVVELPHGLHAVYVLRPLTVPPLPVPASPAEYVMTSPEHKEAVQQALANEIASRSPDGCPF